MALELTSSIKLRLGINANGRIQRAFTDSCYNHMDKYVPCKDKNLRKIVSKRADSITYKMPYAHAQYVGYTTGKVKHYTTPGTGAYWDKKMVSAEMHIIEKEMTELVKRGI